MAKDIVFDTSEPSIIPTDGTYFDDVRHYSYLNACKNYSLEYNPVPVFMLNPKSNVKFRHVYYFDYKNRLQDGTKNVCYDAVDLVDPVHICFFDDRKYQGHIKCYEQPKQKGRALIIPREYMGQIDKYVPVVSGFVDETLILFTILSAVVFLFFNYRPQPKCFSGDVGSVVLGYMMAFFTVSLIIKTGNVAFFLLFAVTFMEAGLTVLQRLFAGDNIFAPHRMHLFQLYCNDFYKSHLLVSGIYSGIQLAFGMALFLMNYYGVSRLVQNAVLWPLFAALCVAYLLIKRKRMGGHLLEYNIDSDRNVKNMFRKN